MILVECEVILLVPYHVCKNFSNGATVMLLVLYYAYKDFRNGGSLCLWYDILYPDE